MASAVEDIIANKVLQECSQDIVDNINVDLVILRLHSKSRLTAQDINRLENISTSQEKKRQLYILALADKGYPAFKDIVDVLNDTGLNLKYQPHADLADKLSKHYQRLLSQYSNKHGESQEVEATVTKKRTETPTDNSERSCSDNDIDHFSDSEHSDDQSQLLPGVSTGDTSQVQKVSASNTRRSTGHSVTSTNTTCGYQSSMESSRRGLNLSSSFQSTSDHMTCRTPSPVKASGECRSVGETTRMDRSIVYSASSNVTRESGFNGSFTSSKFTILKKSSHPLSDMISIKLILLGDSRVGKTSLAQRFIYGTYDDDSPRTIGNKHDQCYYEHTQKKINIKLSVWDTAGEEKFNAMSPLYYRDAHVAVVVFAMNDLKSLHSANNWKTQVLRHLSNKDDIKIPVLLVGNKCDIPERSNEITTCVQGRAENFDDFIEASAKQDYNVESIFEKAVSLALEKHIPRECKGVSLDQQEQQKSFCC